MVNIDSTASSVIGIAGMGIGLGLLAHTAKNIARTTDELYSPSYHRRQRYQSRPYQQRRRRTSRPAATPRRPYPKYKKQASPLYHNYWAPRY